MPRTAYRRGDRGIAGALEHHCRPALEPLEDRLALSQGGPPLVAVQNREWAGGVATFALSDLVQVRAAVDWGDQTRSAGLLVAAGAGAAQVVGTHTYTQQGTFSLTVTLGRAEVELAVSRTT